DFNMTLEAGSTVTQGGVFCQQVFVGAGAPLPDRYYADLPDVGLLFPGDQVHYYITAEDDLGGVLEVATMPGDLADFADFDNVLGYSSSWTMRCLPTIIDEFGTQPAILFWNDFANRGGQNEWYTSFNQLGLVAGTHFDHFYTHGPSSGVGNGLGAHATASQIAGYETLLYTAGNLASFTLSNGDQLNDSGDDVGLITGWLDQGNKNAYMTGDELAGDMSASGVTTGTFLSDYMNVTFNSYNLRPLIGGQTAPRVLITASNPVFTSIDSWVAYGGCAGINTFDAVTAVNDGVRIATFADDSGVDGGYVYSACTIASGVGTAATSEVITMPYDFMFIYTDPNEGSKANATLAARVRVLKDILARFGIVGDPIEVSAAAPAVVMSITNYPNPFNPTTTIKYVAPRNGEMSLKVYNVRGELVRTLINGTVAQGEDSIDWNGKDDRGSRVASGVYFYEVRMGNDVMVNKMALVK
ncbi:hypothetical protein DRQ50_01380, partial [bacterium]